MHTRGPAYLHTYPPSLAGKCVAPLTRVLSTTVNNSTISRCRESTCTHRGVGGGGGGVGEQKELYVKRDSKLVRATRMLTS